jgi:FolB domain-containing protein
MADGHSKTRFLACVTDAEEAATALAHGADLIGVEQPASGLIQPEMVTTIAASVDGAVPVVVPLGPAAAGRADLTGAAQVFTQAGARLLTVDFGTWEDASAGAVELAAVARRFPVLVVLPDVGDPPLELIASLGQAGVSGLLLKVGRERSFDRAGPAAVAGILRAGHAHGLTIGLGGALEPPDIPRLMPFAPDILGFRGALLGRDGRVDGERVAAIRQLIASCGPGSPPGRPVATAEDRIFVHDLVVQAPIGAYSRERDAPQRVKFTVDVCVPHRDRPPEDMRDVLSYDIITDAIREIVAAGHVALVETLAEQVAARVLAHPAAGRVTVRVEKLDVLPGSVGVEIARERSRGETGSTSIGQAQSGPADGTVRCESAIPVLRIFSADKFREFYLGFLGFRLDWESGTEENAPLYAQISRAGLTLHVSEHHGDASPGSTVFVPVQGIDALHRELNARRYRYGRPGIQTLPWGRVLEVFDPFGNRLRFCERRPA